MQKKTSKKKQVKNLSLDLERQNNLIIELTRTRNRAIDQLGYQADRLCMQNVLIDMLIEEIYEMQEPPKSTKEELKDYYTKEAQEKYLGQENNGGTNEKKEERAISKGL